MGQEKREEKVMLQWKIVHAELPTADTHGALQFFIVLFDDTREPVMVRGGKPSPHAPHGEVRT